MTTKEAKKILREILEEKEKNKKDIFQVYAIESIIAHIDALEARAEEHIALDWDYENLIEENNIMRAELESLKGTPVWDISKFSY